ncbi:D-alanyl-D-alanine carboxypeptidase (penicillin-binding protein 5/6) [Arboricoccus pini]|uniref:serine-type D-Ala-D-Ala carboxypeptidase n=1 Tax=Arboricoccus pini TaxID=1963835 RepID=A0A212PWR3_9PROT|nr:D-alanyl-D-alanine carboxypeptidase family protein [Arboricoccus pini]SNB51467.1 D-alanyl-D-alanine carboxypeptidase (penicillin-binding protein 5/6) [Arboricoccus pini]
MCKSRLTLLVMLLVAVLARPALAFDTVAKAAILIDYPSGQVLMEKNADDRIPPASLSKLMTAYLIFERLKSGKLKMDDEMPVSELAWRTQGSKMFVELGSRIKVEDLLRGIIIQSGNDACIVMAEGISGSVDEFVKLMNQKAQDLGLTNSHFANPDGLDDPQHYMSVRDLAKLASAIIRDFPEYYGLYSEKEFVWHNIKQNNRNPLLQMGIPGVDGMKTGHTSVAGFGLVASAMRDNHRLIMVLAGMNSEKERRDEAQKVLEYGFRAFETYKLFDAGQTAAEVPVWLGAESKVAAVPLEPVTATMTADLRPTLEVKARYDEPVAAPITKGQKLGELVITSQGAEPRTVPLVAGADVQKAGMLGRLTGIVGYYTGIGS